MKPEEFKAKMQEIAVDQSADTECMHASADDLMCSLLRELGFSDGIAVFESMEKWYA